VVSVIRFLPVRDDALLVELPDLEQTLALFDSLTQDPIAGVGELIPGARTILVSYRPAVVSPEAIAASVRGREMGNRASAGGALVEVPVTYDGDDLAEVAELLGITTREVVDLHTGSEYSVGFTGFAPGFAYLSGGHPALTVPRRSSPRTRIPAGSVALAGTFSGVYPRESPGGWQLIGTTREQMWDLRRPQPALLLPGDRVRFVEVGAATSTAQAADEGAGIAEEGAGIREPAHVHAASEAASAVEIAAPGMLTLLQDLGRPGHASMGVSSSGALDPVSLRAANRLVGNDSGTACLEMTFGGLTLTARGPQVLSVTGAGVPLTVTDSDGTRRSVAFGTAFALDSGSSLAVGSPRVGLRSYLAVRGGFAVEPILGSLSTDVLAGLGPEPVVAGAVLPIRSVERGLRAVEVGRVAPVALTGTPTDADTPDTDVVVLDVVPGPRTDWFTVEAVASLAAQTWSVSSRSNRVGLRLEGEAITRSPESVNAELPSEGTVSGAIQIPPNGQPVLFLADHPLTGGYPVIGAVATHHLPLAGQLPPGTQLRFNPLGAFAEYAVDESEVQL
jgi:KipI family sensor histidine kinase inhibitor